MRNTRRTQAESSAVQTVHESNKRWNEKTTSHRIRDATITCYANDARLIDETLSYKDSFIPFISFFCYCSSNKGCSRSHENTLRYFRWLWICLLLYLATTIVSHFEDMSSYIYLYPSIFPSITNCRNWYISFRITWHSLQQFVFSFLV